jgi:hypothetical protein
MYKLKLEFETLPKSLNKKLRSNYFKNHKELKSWQMMVELQSFGKKPDYPLPKASIEIIRHSYRLLDYDGLVGSLKPVIDAIVKAGILIDDSWGVTGRWFVDQKFRPKKLGPLLEVTISTRLDT